MAGLLPETAAAAKFRLTQRSSLACGRQAGGPTPPWKRLPSAQESGKNPAVEKPLANLVGDQWNEVSQWDEVSSVNCKSDVREMKVVALPSRFCIEKTTRAAAQW